MTYEALIAGVAQQLDWAETKVSALLEAFVAVVSQQLSDNERITIDDFGIFTTRKQREYIALLAETGQRFLVPPAIEIVFDAAFVPEEGKTGARIHFTPDELLSEAVDAPFSSFEPVLLNEGVTFPNIPEIAVEAEAVEVKPIEVQSVEESPVEAEPVEESPVEAEAIEKESICDDLRDMQAIEEENNDLKHLSPASQLEQKKKEASFPVWVPIMGGMLIALVGFFLGRSTNK